MSRITLFFIALCTVSTVVFAQDVTPRNAGTPKTPVITRHQIHQKARIHQGVRTGKLTRAEAMKLRHEQRAIHREKKIAKADGKVTHAERAKIRHDQRHASKDIHRLKHNNRTAVN